MTDPQQQALPPLPHPMFGGTLSSPLFDADQRRAYAVEAVARVLAASTPSDDKVWSAREADHGPYPEDGTLSQRLRWWIPNDAKHGKTDMESDIIEAAEALEEAPSREVPGWKLVPIEPTEEMCAAAVKFANGDNVYDAVPRAALKVEESIYGEAYAAMLAAAPSSPSVAAEETGHGS